MDVGEKLSELNMTVDEVDKLTNAFKDENFRAMLRDYAREISDPENKKRYEEEIQLLEQERGNNIEFIHPTPFRALKTSVNGKQKCFINICGNDKVGKPECKHGVSDDGRRGQCWSLPHSLHPGRTDMDTKGTKVMIYDVVFHPDTLHIANRSKKFMDMVDSTAIQGIQKTFKVTLDKNNVRAINTKYKGTPQPCIIRKPIPGYKVKEPSERPDSLEFPYPHERRPTTSWQNKSTESPPTNKSSGGKPESFQTQPQKTKEPTKPIYTIKYRSVVDLQDFRCSRDSVQSPRPKEIVVTIDLPLMKSVTDTSLEVQEKQLLLETKEPAYRLELSLAYPVDEDKGEAKFNKQKGQLTVTLPVLPSNEAFDFALVSDDQRQSDGERQEEKTGEEEGGLLKEDDKESSNCEKEEGNVQKWDLNQQTREEKAKEQDNAKVFEKSKDKQHDNMFCICNLEGGERDGATGLKCDIESDQHTLLPVEEANLLAVESRTVASPETEHRAEEGAVKLGSRPESTLKIKTSDIQENGKTEQSVGVTIKGKADAVFQNQTSREESATPTTQSCSVVKDCCVSQGTAELSKLPAANKSNTGGSDNRAAIFSEELAVGAGKQDETELDEDDLPSERVTKPAPVILRETNEDGNETIISDHSTSAGIIFQNTMMYELD